MNDIDIQAAEADEAADRLEDLPCGCVYDSGFGETWPCDEHKPLARYVGGIVGYVIDGRPT